MQLTKKWLEERISSIDNKCEKIGRKEFKIQKDLKLLKKLSIKRRVYYEVIHYINLHENIIDT